MINYRKALQKDVEGVMNLIQTIYPNGYPKTWNNPTSLKKEIGRFWICEDNEIVKGCVALDTNYWPNILVAYPESLMVHPDLRGQGVGSLLLDKVIEDSPTTLITLDRLASVNMTIKKGFIPSAFLPSREYFGKSLESLFLMYHPKISEIQTPINGISKQRIKSKNGQKYLLEIVGTNLKQEEIDEILLSEPNIPAQVVNYNTINQPLDLKLAGTIPLGIKKLIFILKEQ